MRIFICGVQGDTADPTQLNCNWADFLPVTADQPTAVVEPGAGGLASFPLVDVNVLVGLSATGLRGMAGNVVAPTNMH